MRKTLIVLVVLLLVAPTASGREAAEDWLMVELDEIAELRVRRAFALAEPRAESLLKRARREFGQSSRPYVDALDALVRTRVEAGRLEERSLALAGEAVDLRSSLEGPESAALIAPLDVLAYLLHVAAHLETARDMYRWSLQLRQRHHGSESPQAAISLAGLGNVEADLGNAQQGLSLLRQSVAILERHHGKLHPKVAEPGLFRLANLLFDLEDYPAAKELWERTLQIYRRMNDGHGAAEPEELLEAEEQIARSLHNLGVVHHRLGHIEKALEYLEEALRMRLREGTEGEKPFPQFSSSYAALAELKLDLGDFAGAREDYENARRGTRQWMGEDTFRYAEILSNLGRLLEESGEWEEARNLQEGALAIRLEKLGTERDPRVARVLTRLGSVQLKLGDLEEAEINLREALRILEETREPDHSEVAATLIGLARLAELRGRPGEARGHLERSISTLETTRRESPELVEPLHRLADLARRDNQLVRANHLVEHGLALAESAFGPYHPRAVPLLCEKAILLAGTGKAQEALRIALRAESIHREHVRMTIRSFPERQAVDFASTQSAPLDLSLSALALLAERAGGEQVAAVWDQVMHARALVFDAVSSRQWLLRSRHDPELSALASDLARKRQRLAALLVRGRGHLPTARHAELIAEAKRQSEDAERAFASTSSSFRTKRDRTRLGFQDVAASVPRRAALVGIVRFRRHTFTHRNPAEAELQYLAFILRAGAPQPVMVPLGSVQEIDAAVAAWRTAARQGLDGTPASEEVFRKLGWRLRQLIWDPMAVHFDALERLFIVADGSLNLVNPAALPAPGRHYLIEEGPVFHFLTAERDLVEAEPVSTQGNGLLALGGASFFSRDALLASTTPAAVSTSKPLVRSLETCEGFRSQRFFPLPATAQEIDDVVEIWRRRKAGKKESVARSDYIKLEGENASEAELKRLAPGRRVLHLATHGFFLSQHCSPSAARSRSAADVGDSELLSLTGLALAGASVRGLARAGQEDGILTAAEISLLDLAGMEWAVLSACDTGLGDIEAGEGVFGLQRAFAMAGAQTVIMSLWTIDDVSTHHWMRHLYRERFDRGVDSAQAVHNASLRLLETRRRDRQSTHPVYWAGFVSSGEWK